MKHVCQRCGVGFDRPGSGRKYCGRDCYYEAKRDNGKIVGDTKQCARCNVHKAFSLFPIQPTGRAGVGSYCKECSSVYFHEKRGTKPEDRREYRQRLNLTDEERRARKSAAESAWRKANRQKVYGWNKMRRHRERAAGEMPHYLELEFLICRQNAKCPYCNCQLDGAYHLDHILPVSRGGTNDMDNLQLTCIRCNTRKSNKTDAEYRAHILEHGT